MAAFMLLAGGGVARAQFVTTGDKLDKPAEQNVEDTDYSGRVSLGFGAYAESDGAALPDTTASPDLLFWGDLRGRIQASHIKGGRWNAFGDLRIRYTPDTPSDPVAGRADDQTLTTSRGLFGGNEYELKEAFLTRRGVKYDVSLGRMVLRDVDAITIDGVAIGYHKGDRWEYGLGAGMFPNPYSRSLDTDYTLPVDDTRTITGYPAAAATWLGYRTVRAYGAFGAAAILPRNAPGAPSEDPRTFVTTRGYFRVSPVISLFHYLVFDFTGQSGPQLTNLQLLASWRPMPRLTVELGFSHLSTYAIESFLRDLLEQPGAPGAPNMLINNLDVARVSSDEGRVGANYSMLEKRIDVFGTVRYRRRDAIDASVDPTIAALPAEAQIDVSLGARKKKALAGWDVGATIAVIRGDRTSSNWGFLRANRTFLDERLDVDLDVGYIGYADQCEGAPGTPADPTCQGFSTGSTIRFGGSIVFRKSEKWLILADYHLGLNSGTTNNMARPGVTEHSGMLRAQYSF
jgi:hypothetical protein